VCFVDAGGRSLVGGMDADDPHAEAACGLRNPYGDLATIRDQQRSDLVRPNRGRSL
jgi:hypothetical protein